MLIGLIEFYVNFSRSLFEQFRRVANFYFLMISILMLVGTYTSYFDTPYAPWSTLFVLTVVVMISVIKGGVEDLKRHAADRISNHMMIQKLIPRSRIVTEKSATGAVVELDFEAVEWRRVCVGDIIRVDNNSEFPADMILLLSSEEVTWPELLAFSYLLGLFCHISDI